MAQNRVNPFGDIICTPARGAWLGNRGQLHGKGKTILRPFKHKAWIICLLQFKGRHREIMSPNLWTELFFLDEATAMAAGHRPCFECRRDDGMRFKLAWLKGNPAYGYDLTTSITKIDEVLQAERINHTSHKVTFNCPLKSLPNGAFIAMENQAYLVKNERIHLWSAFGYGEGKQISGLTMVDVLTPKSMVNAIREGYALQMAFP